MAKTGRRAKGEGSVGRTKRDDNRYQAYVLIDGKRKYVYGKTRVEVAEKKRALEAEVARGTYLPPSTVTLKEFLDYWLDEYAKRNLAVGTYEGHEINIRKHIVPRLGSTQLQRLTKEQVQKHLLNALHDAELAYNTIRNVRATLFAALAWALEHERVTKNVADGTVVPKAATKKKISILSVEQAQALIAGARDHRLELAVLLGVVLGMRRGEVLGLRWEDVALDAKKPCIWVTGSIRRTKALGQARGKTKTDDSNRQLFLIPPLVEAFRRQAQRQEADRQRAGERWKETGLVITSGVGTAFEQTNLTREFDAMLKRLKLPDVTFHSLRHTAASIMIAGNVNPRVVSEQLGHSEIGITMDLYAHVFPRETEAASIVAGEQLQLVASRTTITWERWSPDRAVVESGTVSGPEEFALLVRFSPKGWTVRRRLPTADGSEAFEDTVVE